MFEIEEEMIITGIDPGPETSGICVWDTTTQTIRTMLSECENNLIVDTAEFERKVDRYIIEDIACFGMPVGKSVFDTLKVIGRLQERFSYQEPMYHMVFKNDIQLHFCNTKKAKDANIKRVLLDRFGEKGTKKHPGITYGLSSHAWDSFALCIYYEDVHVKKEIKIDE